MCKTFLKIWSFDTFSVNDIKAEISCWYLLYLSDWFKWTIVVVLRYCGFLFCTADLGQAGPNFVLGTKPNVWTIENPLQIENQPFFKDPLRIEPSHPTKQITDPNQGLREGFGVQMFTVSWHCQNLVDSQPMKACKCFFFKNIKALEQANTSHLLVWKLLNQLSTFSGVVKTNKAFNSAPQITNNIF